MIRPNIWGAMAISTILLSIVFGCNNPSASSKSVAVVIDSITLQQTEYMLNDTAKPKCHIEINIHYPKSIEGIKELTPVLNEIVIGALGEEYANIPLKEAAEKYKLKFLADYHETEKEYVNFTKEFGEGASIATFSYETAITAKITYCGGNLFSFQVYNYSFTGGAHGNYSLSNFSWNLATNKLIKLDDLFAETSMEDISRIIKETLAKQYGVAPGEKLEENGFFNDSEIMPNNNILLDDTGITWLYNPYEIAPYSTGAPSVTIPYTDLTIFFKEGNPISTFLNK